MLNISVAEDQNIVDLAVEQTGSVEGLFALVSRNGLSLNSPVSPGDKLVWNEALENSIVTEWWAHERGGERLATNERLIADEGLAFSSGFDVGFA